MSVSTKESPSKKQRKSEEEEEEAYLSLSAQIARDVAFEFQKRKTPPAPEELMEVAAFAMIRRMGRSPFPVCLGFQKPEDSHVIAQTELYLGEDAKRDVAVTAGDPVPHAEYVELGVHMGLELVNKILGHENKSLRTKFYSTENFRLSVEKFERTRVDFFHDNTPFVERGWIAKWYA